MLSSNSYYAHSMQIPHFIISRKWIKTRAFYYRGNDFNSQIFYRLRYLSERVTRNRQQAREQRVVKSATGDNENQRRHLTLKAPASTDVPWCFFDLEPVVRERGAFCALLVVRSRCTSWQRLKRRKKDGGEREREWEEDEGMFLFFFFLNTAEFACEFREALNFYGFAPRGKLVRGRYAARFLSLLLRCRRCFLGRRNAITMLWTEKGGSLVAPRWSKGKETKEEVTWRAIRSYSISFSTFVCLERRDLWHHRATLNLYRALCAKVC